jgi:hypothetical protein
VSVAGQGDAANRIQHVDSDFAYIAACFSETGKNCAGEPGRNTRPARFLALRRKEKTAR